jgi:hypothetical protein
MSYSLNSRILSKGWREYFPKASGANRLLSGQHPATLEGTSQSQDFTIGKSADSHPQISAKNTF